MGQGATKEEYTERLKKITTTDVTAADVGFWRDIFLADVTLEDLFTALNAEDVRNMRLHYPQNLAMLLYNSLDQLQFFVNEGHDAEKTMDFKAAGNSLKLLTRIMPVLYEDIAVDPHRPPSSTIGVDFVTHFFWENKKMIDADPDAEYTSIGGQPLTTTSSDGTKSTKPLGQVLMEAILAAGCSRHGCTSPQGVKGAPANGEYEGVDAEKLWYGGLGPVAPHQLASSAAMDANRLLVVRCLLACCSGPLFQPTYLTADPFIDCLTHKVPLGKTFAFSLLNAIIPYEPKGSLPYTSYMTNGRETLMTFSVQLLLILLDNGTLCRELQDAKDDNGKELGRDVTKTGLQTPARGVSLIARASENVFWKVLASIDKKVDMACMYDGLVKLLSNPFEAKKTWLPNSQKALSNTQEILALLWKALDCNVAFRRYIGREADVGRLVVPLCWTMYQAKERRENVAPLQIALYITFLLSGERCFCVALNNKITAPHYLPLPAFQGSYVDLLIVLFQQLAMSGVEWLRPFTDGFLTVVANVSPYTKSLGTVAAAKLVKLFEVVSSPRFLAAAPENHVCAGLLVQAFNNILQYQYEGNTPLVYTILRNKERFYELEANVQGTGPHPIPAEHTGNMSLTTVLTLIRVLYPEMEELYEKNNSTEEDAMLQYLSQTTMVGLLPLPHPILIRGFEATSYIYSYIEHWVWGLVYNAHSFPQVFSGHHVRLFPVYRRNGNALEQINNTGPGVAYDQPQQAAGDAQSSPRPAPPAVEERLPEPEVPEVPLADRIAAAELDVVAMQEELDGVEKLIKKRQASIVETMAKIEAEAREGKK
eukprot:TRINITY_DN14688_c0_g1_i1.p1 TRINITY_DN14688_c0_g1~~TRINITY_DN14688_c0_g1_i1.p1  ORF type:complete len:820 (+),score=328.03 TRINITY_DN14688_c0_g1_i1:89-2548(+)